MSIQPLARLLLLSLVLLPPAAWPVALGEARVKSFLNQPLEAEIDLIGLEPGEHQDLRLRLANQKHFDRLGIIYDHSLSDLSFDVVQSNGRWIVRARSDRPINEPFLDFPLQMSWPGGQMIKQFTWLLDPPSRIQAARIGTARTIPAQTMTAETAKVTDARYGPVQRGETLWPIAQGLKPQGITTRQMAMALLRANPQAFIDDNINKLRAGAVLNIPARPFIEQLDAAAARTEFAAQVRRWQAPVATSPRELPPAAPAVEPEPVEPKSAEADPPQPKAVQTAEADPPQNDERAQLRIVTERQTMETSAEEDQAIKEQLLVTMEEIETNRITTDAIESRLARLEDELSRMQQLVDLKDAQIAALQAEISAREAIQQAAAQAEPPPPVAAVTPSPTPVTASQPSPRSPTPVVAIESAPPVNPDPQHETWYKPFLWLVWAVLAMLGLVAIYLMVRRPQQETQELALADLPTTSRNNSALYEASQAPPQEEIKKAEEDFRNLHQAPPPPEIKEDPAEAPLPDVDIEEVARVEKRAREGLTNSLLDEMLEKEAHVTSTKPAEEPNISDDDIASWVEELDAEVERSQPQSANDDKLELNDDIPSILTELDDQLTSANPDSAVTPANIELDPIEEGPEDDTFRMSLDLARAYLEIGDQDGARDMLKQALASARDPNHRAQIEELLSQID